MSDDPALDGNPAYLHILQGDGYFEKEVRSISLIPEAPPNSLCDAWGISAGSLPEARRSATAIIM